MPEMTAEKIRNLCNRWCATTSKSGAGMKLGPPDLEFRLLKNDIRFHELDFHELSVALVGVSKTLFRPGLSVVTDYDHYFMWAWCGELLAGRRAYGRFCVREEGGLDEQENHFVTLMKATISGALADCREPATSRIEMRLHDNVRDIQAHGAKTFLSHSSSALGYMAFPLLEATLRRACRAYLAPNGEVTGEFAGKRGGRTERNYKKGNRCSNILHALNLHYAIVDSPELLELLDEFRAHLSSVAGGADAYEQIFEWRNGALHGEKQLKTIGGTILNLCFLIALFEIRIGFDDYRDAIAQDCMLTAVFGDRAPWGFYPPVGDGIEGVFNRGDVGELLYPVGVYSQLVQT